MVAHQMVDGLVNVEHQSKMYAEAASLDSYKKKFDFLVSLETTSSSMAARRSQTVDNSLQSTSAAQKSQYKSVKSRPPPPATKISGNPTATKKKTFPCVGCGKNSHPGKTLARRDCPAYSKKCLSCGIEGHFQNVCRKAKSKSAASGEAHHEDEAEDPFTPQDSAAYENAVTYAFVAAEAEKMTESNFLKAPPPLPRK